MSAAVESARRCPRTGICYDCARPGSGPGDGPATGAVFFLNGIGLGHREFRDAIRSMERPMALARYPYGKALHVALTVPGFEDVAERAGSPLRTMGEQGAMLAEFVEGFQAEHAFQEAVLYGFSYGSDLAVDLLERLPSTFPLARAVLAEMNVHAQSCFITSRIVQAYDAARGRAEDRHREAYQGFVSRVVKAHAEGRLSVRLMEDMAEYFQAIRTKDWHQLALSAREVSADPGARVERLLDLAESRPGTRFELVFSEPKDIQAFQRRLAGRPGCRLRVFDASPREHFHHMGRVGILENLAGSVAEASPLSE